MLDRGIVLLLVMKIVIFKFLEIFYGIDNFNSREKIELFLYIIWCWVMN